MHFVYSPVVGTVDDHHFFSVPFAGGIALSPVASSQIQAWNARVGDARSLTASEAAAVLAEKVEAGGADAEVFRAGLSAKVDGLKALVADASKLADAPADLSGDRALIVAYIEQAEALARAALPVSDAQRVADTINRWQDRAEGLDMGPVKAALAGYERTLKGIDNARRLAAKRAEELRAALDRLDSPETASRMAALKVHRDVLRVVPAAVAEFEAAYSTASEALKRMGDALNRLREIAA